MSERQVSMSLHSDEVFCCVPHLTWQAEFDKFILVLPKEIIASKLLNQLFAALLLHDHHHHHHFLTSSYSSSSSRVSV
jgi:hypothetical protein